MKSILLKNGNVTDAKNCTTHFSDVLIENGKITKVCKNILCDDCITIDCTGKIITPGFIDSHVHIESSMVLPQAFGEAILPHGTTSIIADPHEVVNVAGAEGLKFFLDEAKKSPVDIYMVVPSSVPATPLDTNGAGKFLAKDMAEFVNREDIVGLGEVMCFPDVVAGNKEILDKIALFKHKTIDGHTAGMPAEMLDAYVKAGVQNDHECSDTESMMQRYNKGMNIYVREGSAARNAKDLLQYAYDKNLDISQFAFCTDDKHLATIAQEGHISFIVRMALKIGFTWGQVARMASYNPCQFYHLENKGNIEENFIADIVITDANCNKIDLVIKGGEIVTEQNIEQNNDTKFKNTVVFKNLTEKDFILPERLKNVAIELVEGQLLTNKISLCDGEWQKMNLLATIERYGKNGNISTCLVKGYNITNGAIATSVSHDSHNVICVGDNAKDMAVACNRLKELGGGYVIASEGKILGELPLPAFGLMSDKNAKETAEIIQQLEETAHSMGVNTNIDAFITLSFVALPVIPFIRLLDTGLYDMIENKFL